MNLAGFIDTFKEAIAQRVGRVLSAPLPPIGGLVPDPDRVTATSSPDCSAHPWERRPTPSGARPTLPSDPPGHDRRRARWAPARRS